MKCRALAAALLLLGARARAEDPREYETLRYTTPARKDYLRATLEDAFALGIGFIDAAGVSAQWRRFDRTYDWDFFRRKLTGDGQELDGNKLDTNFLGHPGKGAMYYGLARSNRLDPLESFAFALVTAAAWEYLGEANEKASYNDLITTPLGGMAIAETIVQLGAYFDRQPSTFVNRALGFLLGPPKSLHDLIDGVVPDRRRAPWHRFALRADLGATHQRAETAGQAALSFGARVVALPDYEAAGRRSRAWSDGNVTALDLRVAASREGVSDLLVLARAIPCGFYRRRVDLDHAGNLAGTSGWIGAAVAFEYGLHDYEIGGSRPLDAIALVAAGPSGEIVGYSGGARIEARLDAAAGLAGVRPYALPQYAGARGSGELPPVLARQGYGFAADVLVAPAIAIAFGPMEAGARARIDALTGILGADADARGRDPSRFDRRLEASAWIAWALRDAFRLVLVASARERAGVLDGFSASRTQLALSAGTEVRF